MDGIAILFGEGGGVSLDGVRKFNIAKRFGEPSRRAEVNQIENQIQTERFGEIEAFIAPGPIEVPTRWFESMPRQCVAHPFAAQLISGPLEIIFPEFIVLSPLKLVYSKMRDA
jgi:hypothetical protein